VALNGVNRTLKILAAATCLCAIAFMAWYYQRTISADRDRAKVEFVEAWDNFTDNPQSRAEVRRILDSK